MSEPSERETESSPGTVLIGNMVFEVTNSVVVAALIAMLAFVGLQGEFRDLYTWIRGNAPNSGEVSLLTIGEEALYLWDPTEPEPEVTPRGLLAKLVSFLDLAGAQVIVLDVLLEENADNDDLLAAAARTHGSVVAAERFRMTGPPPALASTELVFLSCSTPTHRITDCVQIRSPDPILFALLSSPNHTSNNRTSPSLTQP
jgi:CHASE2 domain-containing sensor protein